MQAELLSIWQYFYKKTHIDQHKMQAHSIPNKKKKWKILIDTTNFLYNKLKILQILEAIIIKPHKTTINRITFILKTDVPDELSHK